MTPTASSETTSRSTRWLVVFIAATSLVLAGCADDDASESSADGGRPAVSETTTTAAVPSSSTTGATEPEPESYGVGTSEFTFTDETRSTPASGDEPSSEERVIDTVVWYPTAGDPGAGARPDAQPATRGAPFPLVVFSHGLGGSPEGAQALLERWVSAGLVVVAPRFPLSRPDNPAGPDGGDVQNQAGDVSFLIDRMVAESADPASPLIGLVDGGRVGASGHSNGAITTIGATLHTCCDDERIDAAVEFAGTATPFADGEYDWDLGPPYLIVHGTEDQQVSYSNAVSLYNELAGSKGLLTLAGGDHISMFAADQQWFDDVAAVTGDFWLAHLLDDSQARARLGSAPRDDQDAVLRWNSGDGPVDVIPTTTVAGVDRQATAEPTTDLADGDLVTVTWSGFTPDGTINVVQCAGDGVSGAGFCDLTKGQILVPNPSGSGSLQLEIVVGPVGEGTCGPGSTDCVIAVNDSGLTTPDAMVNLPLGFAE